MAMCPYCWEDKQYFAPCCPNCNRYVGFIPQTVFMAGMMIVAVGGGLVLFAAFLMMIFTLSG